MNNKTTGNRFESLLCQTLFEHGFWCHNLAQNQAGQPADIIAVVNGRAYLIDCKVCLNRKFPFARVEENQDLSMSLWESCGNGNGWFALLLGEEVYMMAHSVIADDRKNQAGYNASEIQTGIPLNEWIDTILRFGEVEK